MDENKEKEHKVINNEMKSKINNKDLCIPTHIQGYDKNNKNDEYTRINNNEDDNSLSKEKQKKVMGRIIYNHFKKGSNNIQLVNMFKPSINKDPGKIYLKAVEEVELNHLKMKSYDRRTGIFDLKLFNKKASSYGNKNNKNINDFNASKTSFIFNNYNCNSNSISTRLKTISYNDYIRNTLNKRNKYNKLNKKVLHLNKNNDIIWTNNNEEININKDKNFFYTSLYICKSNKKNNNNKTNNKTETESSVVPLSTNQEEKKDIKSEKKKIKRK